MQMYDIVVEQRSCVRVIRHILHNCRQCPLTDIMDASDNAQSSLRVVQYASRLKRHMQICMYAYYVHLFRYDSRMRKDGRSTTRWSESETSPFRLSTFQLYRFNGKSQLFHIKRPISAAHVYLFIIYYFVSITRAVKI